MKPIEQRLHALLEALAAGDQAAAAGLTDASLAAGVGAERILFDALLPSLERAVEGFGSGALFVSELLLAVDAIQSCVDRLQPHFGDARRARVSGLSVIGDGEAANVSALLVRVGEAASVASADRRPRLEDEPLRPRTRARAAFLAGTIMRWFDNGHTTREITRMLVPRLISPEMPAA